MPFINTPRYVPLVEVNPLKRKKSNSDSVQGAEETYLSRISLWKRKLLLIVIFPSRIKINNDTGLFRQQSFDLITKYGTRRSNSNNRRKKLWKVHFYHLSIHFRVSLVLMYCWSCHHVCIPYLLLKLLKLFSTILNQNFWVLKTATPTFHSLATSQISS